MASSEITISVWLFLLIVLVASWAVLDRIFIPSVRWFLRRRVNRVLDEISTRLDIEIKQITTTGDQDRRTALWNLRDTGFFTSQLEDALMAGEADFAVHSFKDLPTAEPEGLTIAAVFDRNFVEDSVVSATAADSIEQLPTAARNRSRT